MREFRYLFLSLCIILFTGCVSGPFYHTAKPEIPQAEVIRIGLETNLQLVSFDGRPAVNLPNSEGTTSRFSSFVKDIIALPGEHKIKLDYSNGSTHSLGSVELSFTAEPGQYVHICYSTSFASWSLYSCNKAEPVWFAPLFVRYCRC